MIEFARSIRFELSKLGNAVDHVVYRQQLTYLGGATGKKHCTVAKKK